MPRGAAVVGAFTVVRQVIPANPAIDVLGSKHVARTGKTAVLSNEDARALFTSIDAGTSAGVRDRALLGAMVWGQCSIVLRRMTHPIVKEQLPCTEA